MEYWIGAVLALAVGLSATFIGLDRDRAFYPTVMIVIASYYGLFAVMGGSNRALIGECVIIAVFFGLSAFGFKRNLWIVVGALSAHGLFDLIHGRVISDPGVPVWWPGFCLTYDIVAAAYLACLLTRSRVAPTRMGYTPATPDHEVGPPRILRPPRMRRHVSDR